MLNKGPYIVTAVQILDDMYAVVTDEWKEQRWKIRDGPGPDFGESDPRGLCPSRLP
jgi:hypothetical protein